MLINLPEYNNGVRKSGGTSYEVDVGFYTKPINSIETFRMVMFPAFLPVTLDRIEEVRNEVARSVDRRKTLETLNEEKKRYKSQVASITREYDEGARHFYKAKIDEGDQFITNANVESTKYVIDNKEAIYELLDSMRDEIHNRLKNNKKEVNKRYYEKRKQLLGIPDKVAMSEEERKEKRRLANQKYREKKKQLDAPETADEQPEEQMSDKDRKKKYNQTYYSRKKQLKERVEELEAELAKCKEQA